MTSILEKGGGTFEGIKLPGENPLPPIEEAIATALAEDNVRFIAALKELL